MWIKRHSRISDIIVCLYIVKIITQISMYKQYNFIQVYAQYDVKNIVLSHFLSTCITDIS
jgi:hypothetical protein